MNPIEAFELERMGILTLREQGLRGEGVTVAVLDTGMVVNPSFGNSIVYDADFTGENRPRDDSYWHGNSMASNVLHVAPDASIANLRVVPSQAPMTRDIVIQALDHCIEVYPRYRIINISLSFEPDNCSDNCPLCNKVNEAYRKGMLVIVAAGNRGPRPGTITCPALAQWCIANISTWSQAERDWWKRMGWLKRIWYVHITGEFGRIYGTSMSAAYSSGAAALLLAAFPKLDADTLRFAMLEVSSALTQEFGHETTIHVDRVYNYLLTLRVYASHPQIMFMKEGALRPWIDPF